MFKPKKKINENSIKKDFSKVVQKEYEVDFVIDTNILKTEFLIIDKFIGNIALPENGTILSILTTLNNSSVDILQNLLIDELIILCSRIDVRSIEKVNHINQKYLFLSDVVKERKPEIFNMAEKSFEKVIVCKNHLKMLLFKIGDNYFICETSANPSINARNEFYSIYNDKNAYEKIIKCLKIREQNKV
ncbi:MAG TPA: hypothetical protein DCS19_01255 [Flavobacterium sp.]|nr:hypothetical protein [Flavobacterium sp.]